MGYFSNLDLEEWEAEELEDMIDEYPNLPKLSEQEIGKFIQRLAWDAQSHYELCCRLESQVDALMSYRSLLKEAGKNVE